MDDGHIDVLSQAVEPLFVVASNVIPVWLHLSVQSKERPDSSYLVMVDNDAISPKYVISKS